MAPPKQKTQKMSLGDFLGDQSLGSWADEMEDMPVSSKNRSAYGMDRRAFSSSGGFGGDRGFDRERYPPREQLPLPTRPPFTAHLGNLSFDATEGDIQDFFAECAVTNVRIIEDKLDHKPKGFAYVEFGTLDGLKKALDANGTQFQGRNIRVSVAEPPKERSEGRELIDWTRKGPLPELPGQQQRRASEKGSFRAYEAADAGSESGGRPRRAPFENDGKVRDFGNWERKGPLSPAASGGPSSGPSGGPASGPPREGGRSRTNDGPRERKLSPAWGEGRSQDGSRPPRREFQERPQVEKQPTAADLNNRWRETMKADAPPAKSPVTTPESSTPASPAQASVPTVRPRLNLQKRTVSTADGAPAPTSASDSKASPFGAAKPIDTAAREAEVEEKRQLALRQKKEAEEKTRAEEKERRASEAATKAEQRVKERNTSVSNESGKESVKDESKENGENAPRANFEILRRMGNDEEGAEDDAVDENANGAIPDDKDTKPREKVVDSKKPEGGSWRKPPAAAAAEAGPTTEVLDAEGWSTVPSSKKDRSRRGGQNAARAIAS